MSNFHIRGFNEFTGEIPEITGPCDCQYTVEAVGYGFKIAHFQADCGAIWTKCARCGDSWTFCSCDPSPGFTLHRAVGVAGKPYRRGLTTTLCGVQAERNRFVLVGESVTCPDCLRQE